MDFTFTSEADEAAALAAQIVGDAQSAAGFDAALWRTLTDAGLLTLALPDSVGGAGLSLIEQCRVLVELGRVVAAVPAATHVVATELLARTSPALISGGPISGDLRTVAVAEGLDVCPAEPTVTAGADGLRGTKVLVRAATHADVLVVTATDADGPATFAVKARDAEIAEQHTSDGDIAGMVTFKDTPATRIGGRESVALLHDLLAVTSAAELLGVTEGALTLTAAYARTREQFGRPIGSFQGVRHRLADGHIDILAQRLTLWQAVWRVDEGMPADTEVATALLWAADAAHRIAHTTVHVHGGVGIDLDGEAHRFFTAAKRWELTSGGATRHAMTIGRALAG